MMVTRQISKLLERFLKPKEAIIIHKHGDWLSRLVVKTPAETNIAEKVTVPYFKVFCKFVNAIPVTKLSNDHSVEQLIK